MSNTISLASYERALGLDAKQFENIVGQDGLDVDGGQGADSVHITRYSLPVVGSMYNVSINGLPPLHLSLDQLKVLNLAQCTAAPDLPGAADFARSFVSGMTLDEMIAMAETKGGAETLKQVQRELEKVGDSRADIVDGALKIAELKGNKEFRLLPPPTQALVLNWLGVDFFAGQRSAVSNISALALSPQLRAVSPDEQQALVMSALERPGDERMRAKLVELTRQPAYASLTPAQKVQAIDQCEKAFERHAKWGSTESFSYNEVALIRTAMQKLDNAQHR